MNFIHPQYLSLLERLPSYKALVRRSEADSYGASHLIAEGLGLSQTPFSPATWCHGAWITRLLHPRQIVNTQPRFALRHLVISEAHSRFLKKHGMKRVHAVGAPFVYVPNENVPRIANSLLVMPPHSLRYTKHSWRQEEYACQISALRSKFDIIVACIHPICIEKGYWLPHFQKHGIPCIHGAQSDDENALKRMSIIFKSFEYVTTNSTGSHLPYAVYSGAKVSIFGSYAGYKAEDFEDSPFYKVFPKLLPLSLSGYSEQTARSEVPWMFVEPDQAIANVKWGNEMLGVESKRESTEIAYLLGWSPCQQAVGHALHKIDRVESKSWRAVQKFGPKQLQTAAENRLRKLEGQL